MTVPLALVGDYDPTVIAHRAIPEALSLSARRCGLEVAPIWLHTASLLPDVETQLSGFGGVWCVPASPYASTEAALKAIQLARTSARPFLGTCGGFQHALLEYARNVLRLGAAGHTELSPEAEVPLISRLRCSLVEQTGTVVLAPDSRLLEIYGVERAVEGYHCNYGLNPEYERLFSGRSGLRVAARDEAGEVRAVELDGHPFFMATLFQPERAALRGIEHPLITGFVAAAARFQRA
jgi:CTP synthase (UTP-ammonia lyase)